jgi:hypothetical protein
MLGALKFAEQLAEGRVPNACLVRLIYVEIL